MGANGFDRVCMRALELIEQRLAVYAGAAVPDAGSEQWTEETSLDAHQLRSIKEEILLMQSLRSTSQYRPILGRILVDTPVSQRDPLIKALNLVAEAFDYLDMAGRRARSAHR